MLSYQTHLVSLAPSHPRTTEVLQQALRANPDLVRNLLDGWREGRTAQIDVDSVRVEQWGEDFVELTFRETTWAACRMETLGVTHACRIASRFTEAGWEMRTLPRDAFGERSDEI